MPCPGCSHFFFLLLLFLPPSRSPVTRWRPPTWRWSLGPTCCRGNEDQMQALTSTLWALRTARPSSTWPWCSYRTTGGSSRYTHMFSCHIVPLHTPQQFQRRIRISSSSILPLQCVTLQVSAELQQEVLMSLIQTDPDIIDYLLRRKLRWSPVCPKISSVLSHCGCEQTDATSVCVFSSAAVIWRWRAAVSRGVVGTQGRLWTLWGPQAGVCPRWSPLRRFSRPTVAAARAAWPARSSSTCSNWTRTGSDRKPDTVLIWWRFI